MRLIAQVGALRAAARRPSVRRLTIGLFLLGPAGLWIAGLPQGGQHSPAAQADSVAADSGGADVEPVTRAWAVSRLERERRETIARLADEFDVAEPLAAHIHDAAVSEAIEPRVAFGLVRAESSFRSRAISPVGAVGLTQLLPTTARWLEPGTGRKDLLEPEVNLRVGFKYLRRLLDQYDGNQKLALTAYNRGPGTVDRLLERGRNPDNGYAEKVLTGRSRRHVALMNAKFGRGAVRAKTGRDRS